MNGYIYLIPVLNIREYEIMFLMKAPSAIVGLFINEPLVCLREGTSVLKVYGITLFSNSRIALTIFCNHIAHAFESTIR